MRFDSRHWLSDSLREKAFKQKGRCRLEYDLFSLGREFGARHLNVGSALKVAYISLEWSSKIASPVAAAGVTGSTARVLSPGQRREVSWAVEERGCQCEWGHSGTETPRPSSRRATQGFVSACIFTTLKSDSSLSPPWSFLLQYGQVLNVTISGPLTLDGLLRVHIKRTRLHERCICIVYMYLHYNI